MSSRGERNRRIVVVVVIRNIRLNDSFVLRWQMESCNLFSMRTLPHSNFDLPANAVYCIDDSHHSG